MLEWLFPNWTSPHVLVALVAARTTLNVALAALVARAVGSRSPLAVVVAAGTVLSAVVMVLVLRGTLGHGPSLAEFGVQIGLLALAGVAVFRNPSTGRTVATALVALAAFVLLLVMVPLYGEATVAP